MDTEAPTPLQRAAEALLQAEGTSQFIIDAARQQNTPLWQRAEERAKAVLKAYEGL